MMHGAATDHVKCKAPTNDAKLKQLLEHTKRQRRLRNMLLMFKFDKDGSGRNASIPYSRWIR